jgi:hypothetical protein
MENKKCSKPPTRLGLLFPTEWTDGFYNTKNVG